MNIFDQGKALLKAQKVQKELKKTEVEAESSNGWVKVTFNGEMRIKEIKFSEDALKPENKRELEKITEKTISEALARVQTVAAEKTRAVMKDLGMNLPF